MKHEFKVPIKVSDDGKSYKIWGDIKKFLSLHPGWQFVLHLKKDRTTQQNRYMWAIFTMIGKEIGMTKEKVHDVLSYKFLQEEEVNEATGEMFIRIKGTSELSKGEMAAFIDAVIVYCADELHIVLPSPGEKFKIDFDEFQTS